MKNFLTMIFAATILFGAQIFSPTIVEARDVWVASKDGGQFYVVTETFQKSGQGQFSVVVKIVTPNAKADEFNDAYRFDFRYEEGSWFYKTAQTGQYRFVDRDPVAKNICGYCIENLW